jgi:bifunctional non-homologous end joining protein LigD
MMTGTGGEFKWDGVRAIAYVGGGQIRLLSRTGRDMTGSYPELAVLAQRVGAPVIVDGEIIAIRHGRPDFGLLQSRMHVRHPPGRLVREVPVQLYLFDLLHHGGQSLLPVPYSGRRERLEELGLDADPVRTTPWYPGGGADVLAASLAHALEGVVGKPLASAYHPGQRRDWIKVKNVRHAEVIICGWKPGQGHRADTIGSLLVGVRDGPRLRYAGHVGTGFTQAALTDLMHRLRPLHRADSPFGAAVPAPHARGAQWVHPQLVGEVAFTEWTSDRVLRHPSWRGLRTDKNPGQVHQES